jgi:hypothetical protein
MNAIGEKLKDLGLRHGEKLGVAIAATLFFLCATFAAKMETINTTPEKIKQATKASESNLTRPEQRDTIISRLEEKGVKDSNFAKVVDDQVKTALAPDDYKSAREWVTTEPDAGLIRDTPVLIAVADLYAYPGRGGLLVYQLDNDGNRIPDPDKNKPKAEAPRKKRKRRRNSGMGMMGGMGGMMGGMGGQRKKRQRSQADIDREAKEKYERTKRQMLAKLAGGEGNDLADQKADEAAAPELPSKEITKGYRWVALTGTLDHSKMLANYRQALKNPAVAHPNYKRLDLQRQTLRPDGTWSGWELVNSDENLKVLDNLPEEDDELAPTSVLPEGLVDPLPFMKQGLWEKVYIASLVPKEKKEIPKEVPTAGGMMGGYGRGASMSGPMMGGRGLMIAGGGPQGGMSMMGGMGGSGRMGMMGRGGMLAGGGLLAGATETAGNYWKSDAPKVMIRALDFTVAEDTTYRYRVRIVVHNPNLNHEDTSAGVDTKATELHGPWSKVSDEVHMPSDVAPYAMETIPASAAADVKVTFQVIRFHPDTGVTVPRNFDAGPGEIIGEPRTVDIPASDGTGKKPKTIDFDSRQILLDVNTLKKTGGFQTLPAAMIGAPIERPALALLLRGDGSVVVHTEADDIANDVRKDIYANYTYELNQSTKKRERGVGMGMMGSMGRSMGGMMGGMGGMR